MRLLYLINVVLKKTNGTHAGVNNSLQGTGAGQKAGILTTISNPGDGPHYGISTTMSGA